ncbi:hypothetical protein HT746_10130 [Burkholderia pyrrocinia]|uniref:hypothetical protein n=1 Tax=Burkholderia pyrrocinia TaxID=60550 RepID=UPI001576DE5C|nr:hypothetical protein [Burkholderia pyrrocinia]NTX27481.1 hypothetical protein [Burkholderia pyrrocinia]
MGEHVEADVDELRVPAVRLLAVPSTKTAAPDDSCRAVSGSTSVSRALPADCSTFSGVPSCVVKCPPAAVTGIVIALCFQAVF